MKKERWRAVADFIGYEVSSYGQVRSYRTNTGKRGKGNGRGSKSALSASAHILTNSVSTTSGHYFVTLYRKHKKHCKFVHVLMMQAFKRKKKRGEQVRHLDGNPQHNVLNNLRWGTAKQNAADRERHGRHAKGEKCGTAKLTKEEVLKIAALLGVRGMGRKLARRFKVSYTTISEINTGKTWSETTGRQKRRKP